MYYHAYPVGFKAQKVVWDILWEMDILEGAAGPVFKVKEG
jgi:hypothetical protein